MLYLIANADRSVAKIGYSKTPEKRLKQLQTGASTRLELLATCRGSIADERKIQAWLSPDRSQGEWFRWSAKIDEILVKWKH